MKSGLALLVAGFLAVTTGCVERIRYEGRANFGDIESYYKGLKQDGKQIRVTNVQGCFISKGGRTYFLGGVDCASEEEARTFMKKLKPEERGRYRQEGSSINAFGPVN